MLRNYLNYAGSKDRYYPTLRVLLERAHELGAHILVDMFTGGAGVAINSLDLFDKVYAWDKNPDLIMIHEWVENHDTEGLFAEIFEVIEKFDLSKDNKEGFLTLREYYNSLLPNVEPCLLYCLITHAFNYSLHTNKKGEFNAPSGAGRSYFNKSLEQKLRNCKEHIDKHNNLFYDVVDALTVKVNYTDGKKRVFFVDPPYSACMSKHPYRVGSIKWTEDEDRELFKRLDDISNNGDLFIFTNVLENNGMFNVPLSKWIEKYHVHRVGIDYTNCSYQRLNRGKTDEIIITNFI